MDLAFSEAWPLDSVNRSWAVATSSSGSATRNARPFRNLTFSTTCPLRRWALTRANVRHHRRQRHQCIFKRRPPRPPPTIKSVVNTIRTRVPRRPPRPRRQYPSAAGLNNTATGRLYCPRTAADSGADVIPACRWAIRVAIPTERAIVS